MIRIQEYIISPQEDGRMIKEFLRDRNYPSKLLSMLKRTRDGITVCGEHKFTTYKLQAGEILTIKIEDESASEQIKPVEMDLEIVYEDIDLMIVNKPAGIASQPSANHLETSLASGVMHYFKDEQFVYRCMNRLDRDTSGLLIIAKNRLSAAILAEMVQNKEIVRKYIAIVKGDFPYNTGEIIAPIARAEGSIIERCVDFENGVSAKTNYENLGCIQGYSKIKLQLETGRTHQIRVHLKYLGYPIIGDFLYNPDYEKIQRQALHSYYLSFHHPITRMPLRFEKEIPADMQRIFN